MKHATNVPGNKAFECRETKKRNCIFKIYCVNCIFKIQAYNLEISEHDTFDPQCPTFWRTIQKEKRRAG